MKAFIAAIIVWAAMAPSAWAEPVRQVAVYDQASGEIIEVVFQGSDTSRWVGSKGILTEQSGITREGHKVAGNKAVQKSKADLDKEKEAKEAADLADELAAINAKVMALEAAGADQEAIAAAQQELAGKQNQITGKQSGK